MLGWLEPVRNPGSGLRKRKRERMWRVGARGGAVWSLHEGRVRKKVLTKALVHGREKGTMVASSDHPPRPLPARIPPPYASHAFCCWPSPPLPRPTRGPSTTTHHACCSWQRLLLVACSLLLLRAAGTPLLRYWAWRLDFASSPIVRVSLYLSHSTSAPAWKMSDDCRDRYLKHPSAGTSNFQVPIFDCKSRRGTTDPIPLSLHRKGPA